MSPSNFIGLSIRTILQGYREKKISAPDIAALCLAQIKAEEARCLAFECFDGERLMQQAKDAQQQIEQHLQQGAPLRPLEAIPVAIKDIFNTSAFPTQMGSPLWKNFTPGNDARSVFHLQRAGALIAGKTVTAEFAVHTLGKTQNPHDITRNPGTSSSGSAAAVASGMVPLALGTQTAGSIVRPASYCGIYGCKPSFGLIPRTGMLKTTDSLDTVGYFTGAQEDLRTVWDVLRVHGRDYPHAERVFNDPARCGAPQGRPWKIGIAKTHTWDHAQDYAKQALLDFAAKLAALPQFDVTDALLPPTLADAHQIHSTIYDRALAYYFQEEYKKAELVSLTMNQLIARGQQITPEQYRNALRAQERLSQYMDKCFHNYDILLSLSTAGHAPLRDEQEPPDPALIWTLTHLPVVSAPAFISPQKLPFGLQIVARRFNDLQLFTFIDTLTAQNLLPPQQSPVLQPTGQ